MAAKVFDELKEKYSLYERTPGKSNYDESPNKEKS